MNETTQSAMDNEVRASRAVFLNATRNPLTEHDAWTWLGLGRACTRTGELNYASKALEKALTLDAENSTVSQIRCFT
jgi:Flp pilus assembly protein TadD